MGILRGRPDPSRTRGAWGAGKVLAKRRVEGTPRRVRQRKISVGHPRQTVTSCRGCGILSRGAASSPRRRLPNDCPPRSRTRYGISGSHTGFLSQRDLGGMLPGEAVLDMDVTGGAWWTLWLLRPRS